MKYRILLTGFLLLTLCWIVTSLEQGNTFAWKSSTTSDGVTPLKWSLSAMPIKYYINPDGFPSQAVISSAQAAFTTWNNAGSKARAEYGGTTTNNTITASDRTNIVIWVGSNFSGDTTNIELTPDTLAMCRYTFYTTGQIVDADIYFNGIDHTWGTDGSPGKFDVQNVLAHEIGHFWGLSDLYDDNSAAFVMYGYAGAGEISKRTLNQDDITGIVTVYGVSTTPTPTPTASPTVMPTTTPTVTPTYPGSPTPYPTPTPDATPTPNPSPTVTPDITLVPTPMPTPNTTSGMHLSVRCTKNYLPSNQLYLGDTFGVEVKVQASKATSGGLAEGLPADGYVTIYSSQQGWEVFLTRDMLGNLVFSPNTAGLVYSWKVTSVDWINVATITIPGGDSSYLGSYVLNGYLVPNGAHHSSITPSTWTVEVK